MIKREPDENRQPQVGRTLDTLAKEIDELSVLIGDLETKLMPVLVKQTNQVSEAVEKEDCLVPLASLINGLACRVRMQTRRAADLAERLEV